MPNLGSYLILLVLMLAAALVLGWWRPHVLLAAFLTLVLVHELGLRLLENLAGWGPSALLVASLWKEAALLGLLVGALRWRAGRGPTDLGWRKLDPVDWMLLLFAAVVLVSGMVSPNRLAGLAGARDYLEPILLFVFARWLLPDRTWAGRLLYVWFGIGLLMGLLAIWQAVGWQADDYVRFGFGLPTGQTGIPEVGIAGESRVRPPASVTGPNELAVHMILLVSSTILGLISFDRRMRIPLALVAVVSLTALVLTASRSGFLGMLAALSVLAATLGLPLVLRRTQQRLKWRRVVPWLMLGLMVLVAAIWVTGFGSFLVQTVTRLGDEYHTRDTLEAIQFLVGHPLGVGMGLAGPRQGIGFPAISAYHVEGSLLQLALESSVAGLAVFLIFLGLALRRSWGAWRNARYAELRILSGTAVAGWAGALVTFVFLPLMQSFPLMVWLWFVLGTGMLAEQLEHGGRGGSAADQGGQAVEQSSVDGS